MSKASRYTSFLRPSACAHRVAPPAASQPTRLPALLALECKRDHSLSHIMLQTQELHTHIQPHVLLPLLLLLHHTPAVQSIHPITTRDTLYTCTYHHLAKPLSVGDPQLARRHPCHCGLPSPAQQTAPVTALGAAGGAVGVL